MIELIITLIVIGILLWLTEAYLPIDPMIKKVIRIVVIVCVVIFVLNAFGVFHFADVPVPQIRR